MFGHLVVGFNLGVLVLGVVERLCLLVLGLCGYRELVFFQVLFRMSKVSIKWICCMHACMGRHMGSLV